LYGFVLDKEEFWLSQVVLTFITMISDIDMVLLLVLTIYDVTFCLFSYDLTATPIVS